MKAVYRYDDDFGFVPSATKIVDDDYVLQVNETFTQPKHGLYKAKYDPQSDDWVGEVMPEPIENNDNQKLIANLTKEIMILQLANQQQTTTMATLTKQLMALQLKGANA